MASTVQAGAVRCGPRSAGRLVAEGSGITAQQREHAGEPPVLLFLSYESGGFTRLPLGEGLIAPATAIGRGAFKTPRATLGAEKPKIAPRGGTRTSGRVSAALSGPTRWRPLGRAASRGVEMRATPCEHCNIATEHWPGPFTSFQLYISIYRYLSPYLILYLSIAI